MSKINSIVQWHSLPSSPELPLTPSDNRPRSVRKTATLYGPLSVFESTFRALSSSHFRITRHTEIRAKMVTTAHVSSSGSSIGYKHQGRKGSACSQGQSLDELTAPRPDEILYRRGIRGQNEGERGRGRVLRCSHPKPILPDNACEGLCNPLQHVPVIAGKIQTKSAN